MYVLDLKIVSVDKTKSFQSLPNDMMSTLMQTYD